MKKIMKYFLSVLVLIIVPVLVTLADPPGPPNPGGNPSVNGGTPVGAPIDNGVFVLLALGIIYGAIKLYQHNLRKQHGLAENEGGSISAE